DSLTLAGLSFSATDATATLRADSFRDAINSANLTGITAASSGGVLTLTNTNSFDDFEVTFDADGANTIAAASEADSGDNVAATAGAGTTTLSYRAEEVTLSGGTKVNEGDSYRITIDGTNYDYIAGKGENMEDVARGLKTAVDTGSVTGVSTRVVQDGSDWNVLVDYDGPSASVTLAGSGQEDGDASGGLFGLQGIDVTTDTAADAALGNIETLIQNSIDAAASFGSVEGRIDTQAEFVSTLVDSLKSGIGTLVDANMEEASARLQALQVQQQLATQSLSIANQAPQSILSLFR
ncbi:MAG: flagellin, partial [Pseudomonadota bacterium]